MAVTRIKNNQITDSTITYQKIATGTLVGSNFNSNLTLNSNVSIIGNLDVTGNTTTVNSINTLINDPLVIFNNGYVGVPSYDVGMLVNRNLASLSTYGGLNTAWVWDETNQSFAGYLTTETGGTFGTIDKSFLANLAIGNISVANSLTIGTTLVAGLASFTAINNTIIGNATPAAGYFTTLFGQNFSTGNAVITGGYAENLSNVYATTSQFTNLSSGNAVITGGYATGLANVDATTGQFTNISSGNAVITGGYANGLANVYATTGQFTNLSSGNAVITGGYAENLSNLYATTGQFNNLSSGNAVITGGYATGLANVYSTLGQFTDFSAANALITDESVTTSVVTNFSTGNAVITGGYATGLANVYSTLGQFTNLSSGNAVITGGYITGIANVDATTSQFTNISSGNAVITGGFAQNLANVYATEGQFTNFSTGNALITTLSLNSLQANNFSSGNVLITGGYADNFKLGSNIAANANVAYFTTNNLVQFLDPTNSLPYVMGSGAFYVAGGMSIAKDIWVGGNLFVANIVSQTSTILEVADPLVYLNANSAVYNYDIGIFSQFVNPDNGQDNYTGWIRSHIYNYWGAFSNISTPPSNAQIDFSDPDIIWDTIKAGDLIVGNTTLATSTTTGALRVHGGAGIQGKLWAGGNIVADSGTVSTTYTNGALVVPGNGGVGIGGNLHVRGESEFTGNITGGNILLSGNINVTVGAVQSSYGVFYGDPTTGIDALYAGKTGFTFLPNVVFQMSGDLDSYLQTNFQNINSGSSASTDFVLTADNGNDTDGFLDLGINSSNYNDPNYPGFYPNDAYLIHHSGLSTGNLVIFSHTTGTVIKLHVGDYGDANVQASVTDQGFKVNAATTSTSTTSGALQVNGGAGIQGNLYVQGLIQAGSASFASINNTPIGNATPSTGTFTDFNASSAVITNFSSGNVLLTGGYAENLANVYATTGQFTNLSSGNAVVTGGYIDSTPIGPNVASSGNFTTANATLVTAYAITVADLNTTTGNILGNLSAANVVVSNSIYAANIITTGTSGNISGANVVSASTFIATGNITANYFIGNIKTSYAEITGGFAQNLDNVYSILGQFTNLSSGNVIITGGYLDNTPIGTNVAAPGSFTTLSTGGLQAQAIGNVTPGTGAFTTLTSSSTFSSQGNIVAGSGTTSTSTVTGALVVSGSGGIGVGGNVNVGANGIFNDNQSATGYFVVKGNTNSTLLYVKAGSVYDQVVLGGSGFLGSFDAGAKLVINSTDSLKLPVGTTGQRPSSAGFTDVAGMIRFNSTSNALEYYDGTMWQAPGVSFTVISSEQFSLQTGNPNGNVDGINSSFTLTYSGTTNGTIVTINGVVQLPTSAYSITGGTTLTFTEPPAIGDVIDVRVLTTTSEVTSLAGSTGYYTVLANNTSVAVTTGPTQANVTTQWIANGAEVNSSGNVLITTSAVATDVDSWSINTYSSAEYLVTATIKDTNIRQICKVYVVHDNSTATFDQVSNVATSGNSLIAFSATVSSGNVLLQGNATNNNTIIRMKKLYQSI